MDLDQNFQVHFFIFLLGFFIFILHIFIGIIMWFYNKLSEDYRLCNILILIKFFLNQML